MTTRTKRNTASRKRVKWGDKVAVPWGLDEIVGQVVEVYGPRGHRHVVVRVPIHGPAGETLQEENISFPEDSLRLIDTQGAT